MFLRNSAMLIAADLMTTDVTTVSPETTMELAIELLLERGVSGLPVVDADGRVLGVITEFAMLAVAYDPVIRADPVRLHMTKPVIVVDKTTPVGRVADLMLLHRIRRVPVTRDGRLLGLISRRDVLRVTTQSRETSCGFPREDTQLGVCK
jgi:CBS domain-containing protein